MGLRMVCVVMMVVLVCVITTSVYAGVASKYDVLRVNASDVYIHNIMDISDSGVIFGSATKYGTHQCGVYRQNVYTGITEFTDQMRSVRDINSSGTVAGIYSERNGTDQYCVWNPDGTITDLPQTQTSLYPEAHIDDSGRVMGESRTSLDRMGYPGTSAFMWDPGYGISAPVLPSTPGFWNIGDMNNLGYYLGGLYPRLILVPDPKPPIIILPDPQPIVISIDMPPLPFVDNQPEFVDAIWSENGDYFGINTPNGYRGIDCMHLNDLNQVAGEIRNGDDGHIFRWDAVNGVVDITAGLNCDLWCADFNDLGQILIEGTLWGSGDAVGAHYIWDEEDGLVSIQDLIDPSSGWVLGNFRGFNDDGWIVSGAWNEITHESTDIILRPVNTPEPGGVLAVFVGMVGFAGFAARRRR